MKLSSMLRILLVALFLAPGMTTLMSAQEQREEAKPEEARPQEARPEQEARPQDEAKPARNEKENDKATKQDEKMSKANKQDEKAAHAQGNNGQRAANQGGGKIPEDKFRSHFGRQHTFKVGHPTIVGGGQPQFQYGGYSFTIVEAWPAGWAYTDDCYIDYIDGEYFLFDLAHPGVQLALIVVI